ncbi:hypothetical protein Z043_105973 [Scleropages formosus]|uniref:Uncharacterized protein n=1 Tax=Scleropages formosus TaxID=113540 RepID=A0A0P7Z2T1_SCLFO|nr:hypothetical protein Z043_105973 [Scleropages formosus]
MRGLDKGSKTSLTMNFIQHYTPAPPHVCESCGVPHGTVHRLHLSLLARGSCLGSEREQLRPTALRSRPPAGLPLPIQGRLGSECTKVEALMREARELREELRKKEQTILLLTQQMSTSAQGGDCPCQQKAAGDERSNRDQATQTLWRGHVPQVLQPSIPCPSVQLASGRLTRTTSTEDPGDVPRSASVDVSPRSGSGSPLDLEDSAAAAAAVCSAPGSHGLRTHHGAELPGRSAFITGATGAIGHPGPVEQPPRPLSGPYADVRHLRFPREKAPAPTQLPGYPSSSSTTRAPLRVRAMEGVARTRVGAAAPLKTKQLPPPSRGLPCFSSGPPAPTASSVNPSALGPPRPRGQREQPGGREPEGGLGKTRGQVPPNQSRLPKPKIH